CQMDIKIDGLPIDIMTRALEQARQGRMHILGIMLQTIPEPKSELSPYAPRFTVMKIPTDTIGAVIGPGGENIRGIVKDTGTEINIEDDGTIIIAATSQEASDHARRLIESIIKRPEEGEIYIATVKEIIEGMGAICEFMPKKSGLLHISQISHERTLNVSDVLKVGDKIEVKLVEVTNDGKFRLSRKALIPLADGSMPPPEEKRRPSPSRYNDRDRGRGGPPPRRRND
ncbi:MAG: KH domain-containing protein, partial [Bacteroidota bacterium]